MVTRETRDTWNWTDIAQGTHTTRGMTKAYI